MKKSLLRGARSLIYAGLAATLLGGPLGISGCNDTTRVDTNPPTSDLYVSQALGIAPLSETVRASCTDPEGNLNSYNLTMNGNVLTTTNPIDTTFNLTQNASFNLECKDKAGNTSKKGPIDVTVFQPAMSETATLSDSININYTATLSNVSQAIRKTLINGALITTDTITGPSYSQTISKAKKGDYEFILTTNNPLVNPDTAKVTVPDYPPFVYLGKVQNLYTDDSITVTLDSIVDENPEDNPVTSTGIADLDSIVQATLSGKQIKITSGDSVAPYSVAINTRTATGIQNQFVLNSKIVPDQIVFSDDPNGNEDIYLADLVNNQLVNIKRLTTDPGQDLETSWSPDGMHIAWATNRNGLLSLYVMNPDGTNAQRVTPSINSDLFYPSWSPNGKELSLIFIDRDLGTTGISKIGVDGTGLTKITEYPGAGYMPWGNNWDKCNGKIFYSSVPSNSTNADIFAADSIGSQITNITNTPNYTEIPSSISPDCTRLLYITTQFGGQYSGYEVMSMAVDGTDIQRITNTYSMEVDPIYSANGKKIIYSRWIDLLDDWQFYIANPDGSDEESLSATGRFSSWRPRIK